MTEQNTTPANPYADPNYRHSVDTGPAYTPPPAPKPKAWWKKPIFILPIACAVLGFGLGATNRPEPVKVLVPGPERVVEKPVEKIVEKTPTACLTALDLADEGFGLAAEAMGYMSAALTAAGNLDLAAMKQANADLDVVTPKMKALTPKMTAAKAECRSAG